MNVEMTAKEVELVCTALLVTEHFMGMSKSVLTHDDGSTVDGLELRALMRRLRKEHLPTK